MKTIAKTKTRNALYGLMSGLFLLAPITAQAQWGINLAKGVDDGGTAVPVEIDVYGGGYVYNGALSTPCHAYWAPSGSLCDEPPTTDNPLISSKTNTHSGATWRSGGTGVLVIDLGEEKTFDVAQVFQMFSDGKLTHFRISSHSASGSTPPGWQDAGWAALNSFDLIGPGTNLGNQVSDPTSISLPATSSRYVKLELQNDGSYDSGVWTELRCLKLFRRVIEVSIDIKPGSPENTVNLGSQGVTKVAILGSEDFDATQVDPLTVELADATVRVKGNGQAQTTLQDTNGDGFLDLVLHMETEGFSLTDGDVSATLTGTTFGGEDIEGEDLVRVVP